VTSTPATMTKLGPGLIAPNGERSDASAEFLVLRGELYGPDYSVRGGASIAQLGSAPNG
jgi:hypothetical protein